MLPFPINTLDYYLKKLTLFMRNSFGMEEHIEVFFNILSDIDSVTDDVLQSLDIDNSYLYDDVLNKIAQVVGVSRNLSVSVEGITKQLTLTNSELLRLVKTKIIQNNYNGTRSQFLSNYSNIFSNIGWIFNIYDGANPGMVVSVLDSSNSGLTQNDRDLFLSGNYTVKSLGISYVYQIINMERAGRWNDLNSNKGWNNSVWQVGS